MRKAPWIAGCIRTRCASRVGRELATGTAAARGFASAVAELPGRTGFARGFCFCCQILTIHSLAAALALRHLRERAKLAGRAGSAGRDGRKLTRGASDACFFDINPVAQSTNEAKRASNARSGAGDAGVEA